jgi:adenosylcobalamin-dependent ribonucleoside-triphosphate reductase
MESKSSLKSIYAYSFKLLPEFLTDMMKLTPQFGYNGLGEIVYQRTYSRLKSDGTKECWQDTIQRVVEGCYSTLKNHQHNLGRLSLSDWNEAKAQKSAQEMYRRLFHMKFLPGGRGLWAQNTPIITEKGLAAALYNCAFVSTANIEEDPTKPFEFFTDALCLGIGVGVDSKGANKIRIRGNNDINQDNNSDNNDYKFVVEDSREGWVNAVKTQIGYFLSSSPSSSSSSRGRPIFDYSNIRAKGTPLKTFGGTASGSQPLIELLENIDSIFNKSRGQLFSGRHINDIFCLIAKCVVSGNIRRSSMISLGDPTDQEFLNLKNYNLNPERESFGWNSNNSIVIDINNKDNIDYKTVTNLITTNGEPGIFFIDNARKYSRMSDNGNDNDHKFDDPDVMGVNPCGEQTLCDYEICNLVENFISRAENFDDFKMTLKFAFLYAKSVTLLPIHWSKTQEIIDKNRRIGTSISGITDFIAKIENKSGKADGKNELMSWMDRGYSYLQELDAKYSAWLKIPKSIKLTSVKPSGTLSLLAGVSPGIHYHTSQYYIRRVRISNTDPLLNQLRESGYFIEPCFGNEDSTCCVEIPVNCGGDQSQDQIENLKTLENNVTISDQYNLTVLAQKYWSDNAVSSTITFKSNEIEQIPNIIKDAQTKLKGLSFLPYFDTKSSPYKQMPYEPITKDIYQQRVKNIKSLKCFNHSKTTNKNMNIMDAQPDKYCNNDMCLKLI